MPMDFYKFFESPLIFGLTQKLNPFSVSLIARMVIDEVPARGQTVLDVGCGIGTRRELFPESQYVGIDINPDYVAHANRKYGGGFEVMDAGRLDFSDDSFDHVVSCAVCHHLDDATASSMFKESLRVVKPSGALHIFDAVLPISQPAPVKRLIFENDRGRHQRTLRQMVALAAKAGKIVNMDVRRSLLHDICYIRISQFSDAVERRAVDADLAPFTDR